jgi:two-component system nitrogen regulation response regulator GlnG
MPHMLVVDDDAATCRLVTAMFREENIGVATAATGTLGLARALELEPDVILLDIQLPDIDGFEVLQRLRARERGVPVVMLTAEHDVKHAVRAMQLGAFDYQTKPVDHDELVLVIKRALEHRALKTEIAELRRQIGQGGGLALQMGPSLAVRNVVEQVATIAATSFSVLVLGETGTGKELVAQAIHRQSKRATHPFIALDCGAIPDALIESELFGHEKGAFTGADRRKRGQLELAAGGTVFLDEIGNMPLLLQTKLLRALEARNVQRVGGDAPTPIDVRFIAATNDDLQKRASDGAFRADLYFRLAQYTVQVPSLRERRDDIAYLSRRFLEEVCIELRRPVIAIAPEAMSALEDYAWPGNVRELRNVIRQGVLEAKGVVLGRTGLQRFLTKATARRAPAKAAVGRSLKEVADAAAREAERDVITETLRATRGNKAEAARLLRTDYKTLHVKMKVLGIRGRDFMP